MEQRLQALVARSTDTDPAHTRFMVDLGRQRTIDVLALCAHNFSLDATVRVVASDTADLSVITADTAGRYLLTNQNLRFGDINWTFFIAGGVVVILIAIAYIVLKKRYWFW